MDTNLKNRLPEEHKNDHSDSHEATKDQPKPSWKHPSRQAPGMSAQTAPHSCQGAEILCPFRAISKMHQAKFYCITRCVALKRTRATFPCAAPRHNSSPSRCAARADLAEISRRTRAVIF